MASVKKGQLVTILSAYDLSGGDTTTDVVRAENFSECSISVVQAGVVGTTKTIVVKLQASADGTAWFDVDASNATVTTADAAASSVGFAASSLVYPYLRCNVDLHADITAGSVTVKFWGRYN